MNLLTPQLKHAMTCLLCFMYEIYASAEPSLPKFFLESGPCKQLYTHRKLSCLRRSFIQHLLTNADTWVALAAQEEAPQSWMSQIKLAAAAQRCLYLQVLQLMLQLDEAAVLAGEQSGKHASLLCPYLAILQLGYVPDTAPCRVIREAGITMHSGQHLHPPGTCLLNAHAWDGIGASAMLAAR